MTKKKFQSSQSKNKSKEKSSINPFEIHINPSKFKILGQKSKDDRGLPGISRAKAYKKREKTLLLEYRDRHKNSRFVDKRIGENNPYLDPEKKMMMRLVAEKKKQLSKAGFMLNDDEDLLHGGNTLNEDTMKDKNAFSDEDDDDDLLDATFVKDKHFGGGIFTQPKEAKDGPKSRREWIDDMIVESKKKKAETKMEKEIHHDAVSELDTKFPEFISSLRPHIMTDEEKEKSKKTCEFRDYDTMVRKILFDRSKRASPADRLKTREEIAKEEQQKLQKLEEERQRRMLGHVNTKSKSQKSADALDDGWVLDVREKSVDEEKFNEIKSLLKTKSKVKKNIDKEMKHSDGNQERKDDSSYCSDASENEEEVEESDVEDEEVEENEMEEEEVEDNDVEVEDEEEIEDNDDEEEVEVEESEVEDEMVEENDVEVEDEEETEDNDDEKEEDVEENDAEVEEEIEDDDDGEEEIEESEVEDEEIEENDFEVASEEEIEEEEIEGNEDEVEEMEVEDDDEEEEMEEFQNEDNDEIDEDTEEVENCEEEEEKELEREKIIQKKTKPTPLVPKKNKTITKQEKSKGIITKLKSSAQEEEELPYTFDVPTEYDGFWDLFENRTPAQVSTIIERMISCNHPSLGADNKTKGNTIFTYILQTLHSICSVDPDLLRKDTHSLSYINSMIPHLYTLTQLSSNDCAAALTEVIDEKYEEYTSRKPRRYPDIDTFIFLKISGLLFPASDFHHDVMTRVLTFLTQILKEAKVECGRDIAALLFTASLLAEYLKRSHRFVGELSNALNGILYLAIPKNHFTENLPVNPPFRSGGPSSQLLMLSETFESCEDLPKLTLSLINEEVNITESFKCTFISEALSLLCKLCTMWTNLASVRGVFYPTKKLLERIPVRNYPDHITSLMQTLKAAIGDLPKQRPHLKKEETVVKTLRMLEPTFEEVFEGVKKRGGNKNLQEQQKLLYKLKREKKGAKRELKRDSQFLARQQLKETLESDAERKRKVNLIMSGLQIQESEYKKYKSKK